MLEQYRAVLGGTKTRAQKPVPAIPTQYEARGCGGLGWLEAPSRIHAARRGFRYHPCGRHSDVTGNFSAPVASPHFKYNDVMTHPTAFALATMAEEPRHALGS